MALFIVTMQERQKDGSILELKVEASAPSREAVIDWYGLNEPDIVSFKIEEM